MWLYRCLYLFTLFATVLLSPFSRKIRAGLAGRGKLKRRIRAHCGKWTKQPLWFHIASSGELEQCLPMMDEIRRRGHHVPIFLSYFSPTAKKAIELESNRRKNADKRIPWDYADFAPFDFPLSVKSFLKELRPSHFIAIHREIWPELLHNCHTRHIPCFLFATYFAPETQRFFLFYKRWLSLFSIIGTVNDQTTHYLKARLPSQSVLTVGDTRIERVVRRKEMQRVPAWASHFKGQNVFLFGSIWKEDFEGIKDTLLALLGKGESGLKDPWRVILAPHQPENGFIDDIRVWFEKHWGPIRLWSEWKETPDETSHLIVNTVGELAELYRVAKLCFVGGSFVKKVHNVLEPAAYGVPIFTGPLIYNSAEATELSEDNKGLTRTSNVKELSQAILALCQDEKGIERQSLKLTQYLNDRMDAAKTYVDLIFDQK